jgi:hypothetical protein
MRVRIRRFRRVELKLHDQPAEGRARQSKLSCSPISSPCCFRYSGSSSTVIPSTPGLPLLALTRCNACLQFSSSQPSSISRSVPARLSDLRFATCVSIPCPVALGVSLLLSTGKASTSCSGWFFCRCPLVSRAAYLPFPLFPLWGTVRAFDHRSRLGLACWLRHSALECLNILADCMPYCAL